DGVVITDDMTMEAIIDNFDIGDASVQSVKAGSDIVMVAHGFENAADIFESLKTAVENGELSEERIDESIIRILQLKEKYQLKDEQIQSFNINTLNEQIKGVLNEFNG
ncbi:beta-N-acetylhexosaminidase, partial [Butyricicoccus sp. 1XD8-22]